MSGDNFDCHSWEEGDIQWVEDKGTAKYPTKYSTVPHKEELSGPNIKTTEVKNHCLRHSVSLGLTVVNFLS